MAKQKSRSARWLEAAGECREAFDKIAASADDLVTALEKLQEVQSEYSDWLDNMPDTLHGSPTGEKLQEIIDLDIESYSTDPLDSWGDVERLIEEAEGIELPQGFGRD